MMTLKRLEQPVKPMKHPLISDHLGKKEKGFAGMLENIQLPNLIQMCCLSMLDLAIRVFRNGKEGVIYIEDGEVVHATCGGQTGEVAFFTILGWENGQFETFWPGQIDERTIDRNHQYLLIEAMRLYDEKNGRKSKSTTSRGVLTNKSPSENRRTRVLVVDDSAIMCKILTGMLAAEDDMEVIGTAKNGKEALELVDYLKPDLITMDVNMPVMDGGTALKHIMIKNPCPVVIMSNLSEGHHETILNFLNLGAVDVLNKPVKHKGLKTQQQNIIEHLRLAAKSDIGRFKRVRTPMVVADKMNFSRSTEPCETLVVIGSGVGGHVGLQQILAKYPEAFEGCLVAFQNIPPEFGNAFAEYLDCRSPFTVIPMGQPSLLKHGTCHLVANERPIRLSRKDEGYAIELDDVISASGSQAYDIDCFLMTVAEASLKNVIVVLLSGADLASLTGLQKVRAKGAKVLIQDLSTCMVPDPLENIIDNGLYDMIVKPADFQMKILLNNEE
jgi:two-component system chemotaxis response regulator CheB